MNVALPLALALTVVPLEDAKPIVQNDRVAVWDVTWTNGKASPPWDQDTVMVFLADCSLEVTGTDGVSRVTVRRAGDVAFIAKSSTHQLRGVSKQAPRTIVIQLAPGALPPLTNTSGAADAFDRPGIEKVLETDKVTVWRYTWALGKKTPLHFHARDVVVVYTDQGVLKSTTPDGTSVLNPNSFGFTKFSPRGRLHYEELVEGKASAVMVELK